MTEEVTKDLDPQQAFAMMHGQVPKMHDKSETNDPDAQENNKREENSETFDAKAKESPSKKEGGTSNDDARLDSGHIPRPMLHKHRQFERSTSFNAPPNANQRRERGQRKDVFESPETAKVKCPGLSALPMVVHGARNGLCP